MVKKSKLDMISSWIAPVSQFFNKNNKHNEQARQHVYDELLSGNARWVEKKMEDDPEFFDRMRVQNPPFLFIGCSDSRVPIDTITSSDPGEIFVHRNVGNQVSVTDMNVLSVLEYAVFVLKVQHIIVGGHYGCGGVESAYHNNSADGPLRNWINPIRDIMMDNRAELDALIDDKAKLQRIVEINVIRQVENLFKTTIVQRQMQVNPQAVRLHGWAIDFESGHIKELPLPIEEWKGKGLVAPGY